MNFSQSGMNEDLHFCYESLNSSCTKIIYPTTIRVLLYIFFLTVIVLTVCGNLLVVFAVTHFKQLHTPTNYLILSLALADLLVGGIVMPPSMVRSLETCWYFGDLFCKIHASTDVTLCNVSIFSLSIISIDRYYAVCQPLHYQTKITTSVVVIMILVSWNLSAIIGFGLIFPEQNIRGDEDPYDKNTCVGGCFVFQTEAVNTVASILSFYVPGLIMLGIYHKIFRIAQKQARSIHSTACQKVCSENRASNVERKATKTLAIVMGVFLSCWTPFFVCNILDPFINKSTPPVLFNIVTWIGYLNSTFNPVVYGFFYSWYRRAFKMIISGKIFQTGSSNTNLSTD